MVGSSPSRLFSMAGRTVARPMWPYAMVQILPQDEVHIGRRLAIVPRRTNATSQGPGESVARPRPAKAGCTDHRTGTRFDSSFADIVWTASSALLRRWALGPGQGSLRRRTWRDSPGDRNRCGRRSSPRTGVLRHRVPPEGQLRTTRCAGLSLRSADPGRTAGQLDDRGGRFDQRTRSECACRKPQSVNAPEVFVPAQASRDRDRPRSQ